MKHSVETFYVAVHFDTRLFGGPEEGEWWYIRSLVATTAKAQSPAIRCFLDFERAIAFSDRLQGFLDRANPQNSVPVSSVNSQGSFLAKVSSEYPTNSNSDRPFYE
jgi:hypothetical protein